MLCPLSNEVLTGVAVNWSACCPRCLRICARAYEYPMAQTGGIRLNAFPLSVPLTHVPRPAQPNRTTSPTSRNPSKIHLKSSRHALPRTTLVHNWPWWRGGRAHYPNGGGTTCRRMHHMLLQNGTHLEADSGLPVELLTEKLRSFSLFFPSPDHLFHSLFSLFSLFLWFARFRFSLLVSFFPVFGLCFSMFIFILMNATEKIFNNFF